MLKTESEQAGLNFNKNNKQLTLAVLSNLLRCISEYNDIIGNTEDEQLRKIFEHQRRTSKEHVAMLTEWMRRNDSDFQKFLSVYLFSEKAMME